MATSKNNQHIQKRRNYKHNQKQIKFKYYNKLIKYVKDNVSNYLQLKENLLGLRKNFCVYKLNSAFKVSTVYKERIIVLEIVKLGFKKVFSISKVSASAFKLAVVTSTVKLISKIKPVQKKSKRLRLKKIKKKIIRIIKKSSYFFRHYNKIAQSKNHWHSQWGNIHLHYQSVLIRQLIQKYYNQFGLYVNKLHILLNIGAITVLVNGFSVFKKPKAKKNIGKYQKNFKSPKLILNLASFLIEINKVKNVHLCFYQLYLPRKYRIEAGIYSFKKIKRLYYFRECLQLIYAIFKGYGSANLLGSLIYTYTRKNPRRAAFLGNIQRLLVWHYKTVTNLKIQGVRIEVKGRFNAKSRAKKRILSVGCVKIHVKSSNVDFAQINAITKFGCLGIKVWICPKKLTKYNIVKILNKWGKRNFLSD